ncbi:aspartate kinase [Urechidicola vernalis]|uniref:Aspartokinase n=1 Tax=Urechidicola vernalis TaxID=3075600 RepID=A0ABU2Y8K5_9FLAO|nr:aspartate kinase [Urechidicola sp. P050]MDT0554201.1 aspartate kinase [Urechidicola sp. P050]
MKVFKFGGASVKDADSVKNVANVLKHENATDVLIVISAMGKMTNAFEKVVLTFFNDPPKLAQEIAFVKAFHQTIISNLFENESHPIFEVLEAEFKTLNNFLDENTSKDYSYVYDQVVSYGEVLSTKIVSAYLNEIGIKNNWLDARLLVRTDTYYRSAKVNWEETESAIITSVSTNSISITQGFIAGNNGTTTTLGREGSDFTAAIFAYCLNAKSVTIWKDVEGILNAHPKYFSNTVLLNQVSYKEATEMAFYGASVIHPKTLKPLENKLIPLVVRSFDNLNSNGTTVQKGEDIVPKTPCFIQKKQQILVSISAKDFSFMVEHNIRDIFQQLHGHKLKVSLIQNSALSFSVCLEDKYDTFKQFYEELKNEFKISYNSDVTLYTIRHFDDASIHRIVNGKKVYLKQSSRETIQIITE